MINELKAQLAAVHEDANKIRLAAEAQGRELTTDEQNQIKAKLARFDSIKEDIATREALDAQAAVLATPEPRKVITGGAPVASPANRGFKNSADFLNAVRAAGQGAGIDPRLVNAAFTTYGSELNGPDGGFLVPTDFRAALNETWASDENLMSRFSVSPTSSNHVELPADETTPHGSSGIVAYNVVEGAAITQTKPVFKKLTWSLETKAALVPVTNQMLSDSALLGSYIPRKIGEKLSALVSSEIVTGSGVGGQFLGILNSPSLVSVTRNAGSNAVDAVDPVAMYARLLRRPGQAFWLIHSSVIPSLALMSNANQQLWMPDFRQAPGGLLLGLPVYISEYCSTAGTSGDIILCNSNGYQIFSNGGVASDTSIHTFFENVATAFRSYVRLAGQPVLQAAVTRKNGSDTLSDFVVLT